MTKCYAFVIDIKGNRLSPTHVNSAWYLIRKKRAKLVCKYPMVIQLFKEVKGQEICKDEIRCGIDDGSKHVGIALVQKCKTKNKVLFKGTIEQRNDVKKLMTLRKIYRTYHRSHKRHRPARFNNRASSRRKGRIAPSILQKRQAIIRVINNLLKWININTFYLEDVVIDIRALTDGYKPYNYTKSNRLDENIRKAVILRDNCKCRECGKSNCKLEVHHIIPKKLNGSNTLDNLITLCSSCHQKTEGNEEKYIEHFQKLLNKKVKSKYLNYAEHVMIGKSWLRNQLLQLGTLQLTTGGDTANKRLEWNIEKTHSNDAICITDLNPDTCDTKEWTIKPFRRQCKSKIDNVLGFKHRDLVQYTYKNGKTYIGYVTALYPIENDLNFESKIKSCKKVNAKKCIFLWRFNKIFWL